VRGCDESDFLVVDAELVRFRRYLLMKAPNNKADDLAGCNPAAEEDDSVETQSGSCSVVEKIC
jgi:hypothetical protein